MARMSSNIEIPRRNFGDSSQLTNLILDSGATCHMTPEISDFIPVSLVETDKYIEVVYRNLVTAKKTGEVKTKMCDHNGRPFVDILYNVLFSPDLCDWLFFILALIYSGHTYLFYKGFCTVFFIDNEKNAVTLPYSAQKKKHFCSKQRKIQNHKRKLLKIKSLWDYFMRY